MLCRALSMWQPWASLYGLGYKGFETRSWETDYRGPIYIHAAKKPLIETLDGLPAEVVALIADLLPFIPENYPKGCLIARGELVACHPMTLDFMRDITSTERMLGDWRPGRFAWEIHGMTMLPKPIPYRGSQGLFYVEVAA
ncbi:MAG: ASCH domain-containing protein [Clostridia bacterium]|nr:ASCH domain-containing protein [Clostridia bacterium]